VFLPRAPATAVLCAFPTQLDRLSPDSSLMLTN